MFDLTGRPRDLLDRIETLRSSYEDRLQGIEEEIAGERQDAIDRSVKTRLGGTI